MRRAVLFLVAQLLAATGLTTTALAAEQAAVPFAEQVPPDAPDYRNSASWAALPEAPGASAAIPPGASPVSAERPADVFYVHPTTDLSSERWNQDVADAATNAWTDVSVIARQASVFNACCQVYAPRYRQASMLGVRSSGPGREGENAYDLAYTDILRAFDDYIEHRNHGRPFILAGHSQGGLMVYRLLRDRIDSRPLQARLVAAYAIGVDLMEGDFGRSFQTLSVCAEPAQTACVLSWNAGTREVNLDQYQSLAGSRYAHEYQTQEGRRGVCVNPLTFRASQPAAPATSSLGAVPGKPGEGAPRALVAGGVAAHCQRGFLVVDVDPALELASLPGGSMHYHDFGLFYEDVRRNAQLRVNHWLQQQADAQP
ncbi:DUF3089 domain-containing protein [Parahaliea maris]|uniref:DUF3089 domain-containing protein n=1 Tax=Parahaliea maris TaxID=2716870 RepID=A0A5C8ZXR9_9GAMM|nr:DUF3089 domain-containing protein [Parahaliea maris]TXS92021.1 DUF3089 domain-containing protein [Parahaliea maris]